MHAIRAFCETLAPEHVVTLSALEEQNATELDYLNEAQNLLEIAANMKNAQTYDHFIVFTHTTAT